MKERTLIRIKKKKKNLQFTVLRNYEINYYWNAYEESDLKFYQEEEMKMF